MEQSSDVGQIANTLLRRKEGHSLQARVQSVAQANQPFDGGDENATICLQAR